MGAGARLDLFDVAGTVAYHGRGEPSAWHVRLELDEGATLTYAGEPFVVGDGADVTRTLDGRPRARTRRPSCGTPSSSAVRARSAGACGP